MNFVIIIPGVIRESAQAFTNVFESPPPHGVASVAAAVREQGHSVTVVEQFAKNLGIEEVVEVVEKIAPEAVGYSCLTPNISMSIELASRIKSKLPGVLQIVGNAHPSEYPQHFLYEGSPISSVVHGEGEQTIVELLRAYESSASFNDVAGISYLDTNTGKVVRTGSREPLSDLSVLPRPAWDLFDYELYRSPLQSFMGMPRPILSVEYSRGCPWKCSFCAQNFARDDTRRREMGDLIDEIGWLYRKFGIDRFGFIDAIFPLNKKDAVEFAEGMMSAGLHKKLRFLATTRTDLVWEEEFRLLAKAGFHVAYLGIESPTDAILEAAAKKSDIGTAKVAVEILRKVGIYSYGLYVLGLPGETRESMKHTLDFSIDLDTDVASFSRFSPYAGSPFDREQLVMEDHSSHWLADNWVRDGECLQPGTQLSINEVARFQRYAMRKYFFRASKVAKVLVDPKISNFEMALGGGRLLQAMVKDKVATLFAN